MTDGQNYVNRYMQEALNGLHQAEPDEVPCCSLIVLQNRIIGVGHNQTRTSNHISAHAEIIALQNAANFLHDWRLNEADLFVTMEPCMMCMGAIRLSRIRALYYGLSNSVTGIFSVYKHISLQDFPEIHIQGGILEQPIREKMKSFFQIKRG